MKKSKNKIYSFIPLYVLDYPLFILGILIFIASFSLKTFVLIFVFWAAGSSIQGLITHLYNLIVYFNLYYLYILRYRNCTFERFRAEEFLSTEFVNELRTERLGIGLSNKPLGFITVVKRKKGSAEKQFPSAMTTFPIETEPWYIMVSDKRDELFDYQWFVLLHEIGHTMVYHKIPLERNINLPTQVLVFSGILLLICSFPSEVYLLVIGLSLLSCYLFATYKTPDIHYEIIADTFSLLTINSCILEKTAKEHIDNLNNEIFESNYRNDVASEVEIRKQNIEDVLQYRLALKDEADVRITMKKFDASAMYLLWVEWYYYLPIVAILTIGLCYFPIITWNTVLIGIIIVIICFLASLLLITFYKRFLKDRIDIVMNQKEVTSDLYSEHFLKVESILHRKYIKAKIL